LIDKPNFSVCCLTVFTNQRSVSFCGLTITSAPTERFAIVFDKNNEINEPLKPNNAAKINKPVASWARMPVSVRIILNTNKTAIFVIKNKTIRIISDFLLFIMLLCKLCFYIAFLYQFSRV